MTAPTNTLAMTRTKQEVNGKEASGASPFTPLTAEVEPIPRGSLGTPAGQAPRPVGSPAALAPSSAAGPTPRTRPAHGDRNRYLRGPNENNEPGKGCRCRPCKNANNAAQNRRRMDIDSGRQKPLTDAEPARQHALYLVQAGLSYPRIAQLAGIPRDYLNHLLYGKRGTRTSKMHPNRAAAILAVRPTELPEAGWVPASGTRRRLRALAAVGWPGRIIAEHIGITDRQVSVITAGRAGRVTVQTAKKTRAVYDRLWNVDPAQAGVAKASVTQTQRRAEKNGWAMPQAWDDDIIDDPAAQPDPVAKTRRSLALAENSEELLRQGFTIAQTAERLGVSRANLDYARFRAASREQVSA